MGVLNYTMWMLKYTLWDSQWSSHYTPRVLLGQNCVLISVLADGACAQCPCYEMISTKIQTLSKDGGGLWASATEPACTRQVELATTTLLDRLHILCGIDYECISAKRQHYTCATSFHHSPGASLPLQADFS